MNSSSSSEGKGKMKRINAPFWVTLFRGLLAAILGLVLAFQPDKARPVLVNFIGMFWLASGIMSVRWGARGQETRQTWPIVAGIAGIIAGLLALSRRLTAGVLSELIILNLLGGVMILTGIIHITGGFRVGRQERHQTWASILLGVFEVILGSLALLAQSLEFGQAFYWALTIWALLGGFMLFADALAIRRQARQASPGKLNQT
jgi:uncharacterized membrane protein HdeD (DUF308 family)